MYKLKSIIFYDTVGVSDKLWISLEEKTDFLWQFVAHLLVILLIQNVATEPYLIFCKMLEIVNRKTIPDFITESFRNLRSNGIKKN